MAYLRKTVRRMTVRVPTVDKDGNQTTKPIKIPMPISGVKLSEKHKLEVVNALLAIYMHPDHSMTTATSSINIQRATLHNWRKEHPKINDLVDAAIIEKKSQRKQMEQEIARSTAMKLMQGYTVTLDSKKLIRVLNKEGEYEYVEAEVKTTEQYIKPSENLIMRRLENDHSEWRKDAGDVDTGDLDIPLITWVGGDDE